MPTKQILFIHGMFMTHRCWDGWVRSFEAQGYACTALPWPGRDQPVEALRRNHPDPAVGQLTFTQVVNHFSAAVSAMPEPPILIGHSMGGLVTQVLINRGLGAAGVCIDPAPPQGVFTTAWSFLKANWVMINPFISSATPYIQTFEEFQYAFVNGLSLADQRAAYDQQVVPESRRVPRETLTAAAKIDFARPHAPLLILAGSSDHIIPASLNRSNYARYSASPSTTDFIEFPGRNHYGLASPGWEELASAVADWLKKQSLSN